MDTADRIEIGVELLANLEFESLPLAEAIDRLEMVTTDPEVTRTILDTADRRGLIRREGAIIRPKAGQFVRFGRDVVAREGEFSCRRCGAACTTGYFIEFESGELGPFGGTCIRYVTGRNR